MMDELKKLKWQKLDASIVDINIKGKVLCDVYGHYSCYKERAYWWCIEKMNRFINDYNLSLINYGITGCNCNFYTFEFLLKDDLDNKYLIVETARSSKYYTTNEFLIKASRKYCKQLKAQNQ